MTRGRPPEPRRRGCLGRLFDVAVTVPMAVFVVAAALFVDGNGWPDLFRVVVATIAGGAVLMAPWSASRAWAGLLFSAMVTMGVGYWWWQLPPAAERDWWEPQSRAAWAELDDTEVTLHDVRDFRWREDGWTAAWRDETVDVQQLEQTYFVLTRFTGLEGVGHVMVSFRFADDRFVVISPEIRRETGEHFDPISGLFRQFELIYVVADERDAIGLRTRVHGDDTWVFPIDAALEKQREYFVDMVVRLNGLHEQPEWYNTLTNSCSTALAEHFEHTSGDRLPLDYRVLLPGYSDDLVYELGLLPDGLTADEGRERWGVTETARALEGIDADFSLRIRGEEPRLPGPGDHDDGSDRDR